MLSLNFPKVIKYDIITFTNSTWWLFKVTVPNLMLNLSFKWLIILSTTVS